VNLLSQKRVFITWAEHNSRSRSLAYHLEAKNYFIQKINSKSKFLAPLKYILNTIVTLNVLNKENPDVVFIVNPPVFAVLVVWMYSIFHNSVYIVDTHSAAFTAKRWSIFLWLYRFLSKRALVNILHNEVLEQKVARWGSLTTKLYCYIQPRAGKTYPLRKGFNVVFISLYSKDEPLEEVIEAARKMPRVNFYITGSLARAPKSIINKAPDNIIFTDFLSDEKYGALLRDCDIAICLTKNDNTVQGGASEALALKRPIITSNWPVLEDVYYKGAICIDNTSDSIVNAIGQIRYDYPRYLQEIEELQVEFKKIWQKDFSKLLRVLDNWSDKKY